MAPLTQWSTQLMLSYATTKLGLEKPCLDAPKPAKTLSNYGGSSISAISWGFNRVDAFGVDDHGSLAHQYWDGYQWGPSFDQIETLGGEFASPPTAVSTGTGRLDIFEVGSNGSLIHKYYDGTAWQPSATAFESLGGDFDANVPLAVTVNGSNPIDVFGKASDSSSIYHKFWEGSNWRPKGDIAENLDDGITKFGSGPTAVSWGPNRTDVFALDTDSKTVHQYWDGNTWLTQWESLGDAQLIGPPTAISWGVNRLDLFGIDAHSGHVLHYYWDGSQWNGWEDLGHAYNRSVSFVGTVAATSWSVNRIDVVVLGSNGAYYYKYWDGSSWGNHLFAPKGGNFSSSPAVTSWGENRLDIFGVGKDDSKLKHLTWYGSGWYPAERSFETLGGPLESFE